MICSTIIKAPDEGGIVILHFTDERAKAQQELLTKDHRPSKGEIWI